MIRSLKALAEAPDDVLREEHDRIAPSTEAGTDYYVDELNRRAATREAEAMQTLATHANKLAVTNMVLSAVAVAIALVAFLR